MRAPLLLVLGLASVILACPRSRQSPPLAVWSGPRFSVAYPAGWVVRPDGDDRVAFDGTSTEGPWTFGRTLTITRAGGRAEIESGFDWGCGSHVCSSTLTVGRGAYTLVFRDRYSGDGWSYGEEESERELRALAERIVPTLSDR